jgi:DNA invertase Pin-like site-specific DNA recombinase
MTSTKATGEPLRVVGYIRVSTEEQRRSGAGLAAQRKAIQDACDQRGWTLLRIEADEAASGKSTTNRPGYARAVEAVTTGAAAGLVVAKLDRLSRSVRDFCGLLDASAKQGWALVCLDLGLDTSTPTGKFTAQIIAAVAELERELIGQRTREGLERQRAKGVRIGGRPVINEELAERIRAMRAAGATLEGICEVLNTEGVPTPRGGAEWRPSSITRVLSRS